MLPRQLWLVAVLPVLITPAIPIAGAQSSRPRHVESLGCLRHAAASGLITDRLTAKELKCWSAIERLAKAVDTRGQPLYPTLLGLWQWAETSGHAIYIEMPPQSSIPTCTAGSFYIEGLDPQGESHIAVIRLYLANIDQAYIGPEARRTDGLIPFEGLRKEERYAEVLGHELAHAADILTSRSRAQMVKEMVEQTNELLLSHHKQYGGQQLGPEIQQRLSQRDYLLEEMEKRAEALEKMVWTELKANQRTKVGKPRAQTIYPSVQGPQACATHSIGGMLWTK